MGSPTGTADAPAALPNANDLATPSAYQPHPQMERDPPANESEISIDHTAERLGARSWGESRCPVRDWWRRWALIAIFRVQLRVSHKRVRDFKATKIPPKI